MRYAEGVRKETRPARKLPRSKLGWFIWVCEYAIRGLAWFALRAAYALALVLRRPWGRLAAGAVLVIVLCDATWGNDGIGVPVIGNLLAFLALGIAGIRPYKERRAWEEHVKDVVYHTVDGHTRAQPERVRFGEYRMPNWDVPWAVNSGTFTGRWDVRFRVPAAVTRSKLVDLEIGLRERLPAERGASWDFDWNLRSGACFARLVDDLPEWVRREHASPDPERVPIGVSRSGEERIAYWILDQNFGHLLITGGTGGGKSVIVNNIFRHCQEHADDFEVDAIDMKGGVELHGLLKYPIVRTVAEDLDSSLRVLRDARTEVDRRLALLKTDGAKKIAVLNDRRLACGEPKLKRRMILVDEVAELTDVPDHPGRDPESKAQDAKRAECRALLDSIVRLGRAGGIHVAGALQRPDARYLGGALRSNMQARAITGTLDRSGAQMVESELARSLPGERGRGVFWLGGQEEEVQFYLIEEEDLDRAAFGPAAPVPGVAPEGSA